MSVYKIFVMFFGRTKIFYPNSRELSSIQKTYTEKRLSRYGKPGFCKNFFEKLKIKLYFNSEVTKIT